jgi:hypothetical protein
MEFRNPFSEEGRWFKGNIHIHTKNSDGSLSPEEIVKIYRENNYNFLFITDHNKITDYKSPFSDFLIIKGVEFNKNGFHILGLDLNEIFDIENLSPQEIINKINELGGFSVICHPYWSALKSQEIITLSGFIGIEIYNNNCEKEKGKGYSNIHYDEILGDGYKLFCFAVDDAHYHFDEHRENDICGSFIMVKAKSFKKEEIVSSIKNGLFYSSTGVIIENMEIENNKIKISFTPSKEVDFIGYGPTGRRFSGKGNEINYADYEIKGNERYIRIEITDKENKKAWTNPIYL